MTDSFIIYNSNSAPCMASKRLKTKVNLFDTNIQLKKCQILLNIILEQPFDYPILTNWDTIDDGLKFKQCVKDRVVNKEDPLQQFVVSDNETEVVDLLAQFSPRQRKRILR